MNSVVAGTQGQQWKLLVNEIKKGIDGARSENEDLPNGTHQQDSDSPSSFTSSSGASCSVVYIKPPPPYCATDDAVGGTGKEDKHLFDDDFNLGRLRSDRSRVLGNGLRSLADQCFEVHQDRTDVNGLAEEDWNDSRTTFTETTFSSTGINPEPLESQSHSKPRASGPLATAEPYQCVAMSPISHYCSLTQFSERPSINREVNVQDTTQTPLPANRARPTSFPTRQRNAYPLNMLPSTSSNNHSVDPAYASNRYYINETLAVTPHIIASFPLNDRQDPTRPVRVHKRQQRRNRHRTTPRRRRSSQLVGRSAAYRVARRNAIKNKRRKSAAESMHKYHANCKLGDEEQVPDNFFLSIFALLCFMPLGIVAMFYTFLVRRHLSRHNNDKAFISSLKGRKLGNTGVMFGITGLATAVVLFVVKTNVPFAWAEYDYYLPDYNSG